MAAKVQFENRMQKKHGYYFAKIEMEYIFAVRKGGAIAQLVEHRTENPGVPGSIPGGTTLRKADTSRLFAFPGFRIGSLLIYFRNSGNAKIRVTISGVWFFL